MTLPRSRAFLHASGNQRFPDLEFINRETAAFLQFMFFRGRYESKALSSVIPAIFGLIPILAYVASS